MGRISVELVPRSEDGLREDLKTIQNSVEGVDVINIPDLLRLDIRSWEGAAIAQEYFPAVMPHIRAIDVDLTKPLAMRLELRRSGITEVLVIEGDPPQDMSHKFYPTVTTDVIQKFHQEMPEVKVYAGIDQYRGSMRQEMYRIQRKLQAGAVGFFTQPFFDLRFMEMYADMLEGQNVYWGVSPVMSERSQSYWELKNNVVFPKGFEPTLNWSIDFSRKALEFVKKRGANLYLMPIKSNLEAYLKGVLG
ncbi:MAG: methylenetetrahydrofolate reductase [Anaerovibrio sp.]|uniref:methylenetetrahydrofolate reductase n=1 Tax=Anaerovibrio sp. TaxID=1872532 RepID=UPI0025BB5821|nr:methylenetetrahydrofolate reductase [Anaerovibrio sp.]MBE6099606.1 methylenetetrahydrofolate reductase [Anaerovibrio sp.]